MRILGAGREVSNGKTGDSSAKRRGIVRHGLSLGMAGLFAINTLHFTSSAAFGRDVAAVVTQIVGALYLKEAQSSSYRRAKKGEFVYEGTSLKTGQGDQAAISFVSGTEVKINENTLYIVRTTHPSRKGQGNDSTLSFGRIWFKVLRKQSKFNIKTPVAAVSVRGTEGDLNMSGNILRAACYEGTFQVASRPGGADDGTVPDLDEREDSGVPVNAGQMAMVTGGKPPVVQPLDRKDTWHEKVNVYQKGTIRLAAGRQTRERDGSDLVMTEIAVESSAREAATGQLYVDDEANAVVSVQGTAESDFQSGPVRVSLKNGDKIYVRTKRTGYFNVNGLFDGFEVVPARIFIPESRRETPPSETRERELEVEIQDEKGERKKIRLQFRKN
jgi:hypothetical protein